MGLYPHVDCASTLIHEDVHFSVLKSFRWIYSIHSSMIWCLSQVYCLLYPGVGRDLLGSYNVYSPIHWLVSNLYWLNSYILELYCLDILINPFSNLLQDFKPQKKWLKLISLILDDWCAVDVLFSIQLDYYNHPIYDS